MDKNALWSQIQRNSPIQITVANMIAFGLTFLTAPMVARAIGPTGRGETAAALAAFVIAPVLLAFGLPLEIRRRCAQRVDEPSVRSGRDLALVSLAPAVVLGWLFVSLVFRDSPLALQAMAFIGLASTPVAMALSLDAAALLGSGRYRAYALLRVTQPVVVFCSVPLLWWSGLLAPEVGLALHVVGTALTWACGRALVRVSWRGSRARHGELLKGGVVYAGSAIAEAASARVDQVLVLPLIGAAATGHYSVAASIAALPLALGHALGARFFRDSALSNGPTERAAVASRSISEIVSITIPSCVGLGILSIWLVPLLFGAEFASSVELLMWLSPGAAALTVAYVGSMLLAAEGLGRVMTLSQLVSLVIGVMLLYVLAPAWSAVGASIASSISSMVLLTLQVRSLRVPTTSLLPRWRSLRNALRSLGA